MGGVLLFGKFRIKYQYFSGRLMRRDFCNLALLARKDQNVTPKEASKEVAVK